MNISEQKPAAEWLPDYQTAFGTDGMIALSWGLGSLFAESIRKDHKSFPFLEITGEARTGKTILTKLLLKLLGNEGDSFHPNACTRAALDRLLQKPQHGPIAFIDADDCRPGNYFDWDCIKNLYAAI